MPLSEDNKRCMERILDSLADIERDYEDPALLVPDYDDPYNPLVAIEAVTVVCYGLVRQRQNARRALEHERQRSATFESARLMDGVVDKLRPMLHKIATGEDDK